jgi:hypothetical protein
VVALAAVRLRALARGVRRAPVQQWRNVAMTDPMTDGRKFKQWLKDDERRQADQAAKAMALEEVGPMRPSNDELKPTADSLRFLVS